MKVCAIIAAAGLGKRMGSSIYKQFLMIENKPILVQTLEKFNHCDLIDSIIIVVPSDRVIYVTEEIVPKFKTDKALQVVMGGETRQDSVFAALKAVAGNYHTVVIHDAVRPLIPSSVLQQVIVKGLETGAAVTAIPVQESIKKVTQGQVVYTIDRSSLWIVQTPQVFRRDLILRAYERAYLDHIQATDDSELVEHAGFSVHVVQGSRLNIKITTPEDLALAKQLINLVN